MAASLSLRPRAPLSSLARSSARTRAPSSPQLALPPTSSARICARAQSSTCSTHQSSAIARAPVSGALSVPWAAPPPAAAPTPTFTARAKLRCQLWETEHPLKVLEPDALTSCTSHLRHTSAVDLVRQWVVLAASANAALVRRGPAIVRALEWIRAHVPVLGELVWKGFEMAMRPTFFRIFVGGESVSSCGPRIECYASQGVGSLLNYSAESDHAHDSGHHAGPAILQEQVDEAVYALSQCGAYPASGAPVGIKSTFVSIKLTGIISDAFVLKRASDALHGASDADLEGVVFPSASLSPSDERTLHALYESMRTIASQARHSQARLLVDAEQSWFQPAIDRIVDLLAEEFNKPGVPAAIVFNTYQAYKRSTPSYLRASIERADKKGYMFGAKLVRGAYMEEERERHLEQRAAGECVVWGTKTETDASYDGCAELLARRIAEQVIGGEGLKTDVCFAGHNGTSVKKVLEVLSNEGLLTREEGGPGLVLDERLRGRVQWGQLMGMSDNLTDTLTSLLYPSRAATPSAGLPYLFKAIPYATVEQAIPYLLRRANENQSILQGDPTSGRGGAREARKAVGREMRRRMLGEAFAS